MKHIAFLTASLLLILLFQACGNSSEHTEAGPASTTTEAPTTDKVKPTPGGFAPGTGPAYAYQNTDAFRNRWGKAAPVPVIDLAQDLTQLTLEEVRLLRETIYARKGGLTADDQLRTYFMGKDWYQPVWWDEAYEPQLDPEEKAFIQRARDHENALQNTQFPKDGNSLLADRIVNRFMYKKEVLRAIEPTLEQHAVAIQPGKYDQMFHLYDENNYAAIPSFITSDFYLQLLNIYFSRLLQELETDKFSPIVQELCEKLYAENAKDIATIEDPTWKAAAEFNQMFFGMAYEFLTGKRKPIPARLEAAYINEIARIKSASGQGSKLLQSEFFDFSLFKPRGHYTRTPALSSYFKAMMWLQTPPFYQENPEAFHGAMVTATHFLESPAILNLYHQLSDPVEFLVGEPNRNSLLHLYEVMKNAGMPADPAAFFSPEYEASVVQSVKALQIQGFRNPGADEVTQKELNKFAVYFLPQRYTMDAEILIRLVNITRNDLRDAPNRPFPKGLDVFAALGSATAEDILLRQFKEADAWAAYPDSLKVLQRKFAAYPHWEKNGYNRWMKMLQELLSYDEKQDFFMQTQGWRLKSLNTALGSWAELKHNTLLYAEQPMAAQMGDGGEDWPAAYVTGYVEPNPRFWARATALVRTIEQKLSSLDLLTKNIADKSRQLTEMGKQLKTIAEKEVRGEMLSNKEKDYIRFIGGEAEWLTLRLLDKENMSWYEVNATDKFMAVVADVYTYQGQKEENRKVLEEAVGYADELFVVVEMPGGELQLMRGAAFSYYEFKQPINERLTDEEWQKMLIEDKAPARPVWMKEILVEK